MPFNTGYFLVVVTAEVGLEKGLKGGMIRSHIKENNPHVTGGVEVRMKMFVGMSRQVGGHGWCLWLKRMAVSNKNKWIRSEGQSLKGLEGPAEKLELDIVEEAEPVEGFKEGSGWRDCLQ